MILGVVFGRIQVDASVVAGTFASFGFPTPVRSRRGLILPWLFLISLLLSDRPSSQKKGNERNKNKPAHR
jgi:hypothetical protein